ncbi:histidine phosphotransferase [Shimia sp. R10_1]|uniref:histidine phosphotransferase family protein n=1 Tax=Shimia sp. R10_1 TaxID=2821095 RepID=UPI001ADD06D4|nr:histidine phosphotransferase family protein [Shimia sp. R10_1]MBO9472201.1 histidine phosphotransferase [Shimia sp. R10_1]
MSDNTDFSALVGSRICHDLISPVGAIGNGLELLALTGDAKGPEMEMIEDSVKNANARIRLFRVAFGQPGDEQMVGTQEIQSILSDLAPASRVETFWEVEGAVARSELRLAFLTLMCFETSMPFGGTISIAKEGAGWYLLAESEKLRADTDLWGPVSHGDVPEGLVPAKVQFGLLPQGVNLLGRTLNVSMTDMSLEVRF